MVAGIVGTNGEGTHAWNLLKLALGALLAMNIMMLALLLYSGAAEMEAVPVFRWVMLTLAVPALLILLYPMIIAALKQILQKRPGLELLIVGGAIASFSVSALHTVVNDGEVYFDTAVMLPVLVTFGKIIEASAKRKASSLLQTLQALLPQTALKVAGGKSVEVPIESLEPGDMLQIRPGERLPADGLIVEGNTIIEEAAFTGEALPQPRGPGDRVIAGTTNGAGCLLIRAEKTGKELLLQRIITMIQDAWEQPSPSERIAEEVARWFTLAVALTAIITLAVWGAYGNPMQGCLSALSVLVVACPCTMGIATPLATSLAIARAATAGIVVRGGDTMEQLGQTDQVFFDKTGTLTANQAGVHKILCHDPGIDEDELLAMIATLESASEHPLARAIVKEAISRNVETGAVSLVTATPGLGISGVVHLKGKATMVVAGSRHAIPVAQELPATDCGLTAVHVAWDGAARGVVLLADTLRPDAARTIEALAKQHVQCVLLSGDSQQAAATIADKAGVKEVLAPLNPAGKFEAVTSARAAGRNTAMIGDGINDAAALAAAHVGIAFGSGIELVRQAGNVVMVSNRLMQIPWLLELSRQTRRIVRQNFAWSFGYNAIALGAAAAGLLHPLLAAIAMVISSLTVLGNSLRVTRFPIH